MIVEIQLSDADVERLATRVVQLLNSSFAWRDRAWLDVAGAGAHLGLSEHAFAVWSSAGGFPFTEQRTAASDSP